MGGWIFSGLPMGHSAGWVEGLRGKPRQSGSGVPDPVTAFPMVPSLPGHFTATLLNTLSVIEVTGPLKSHHLLRVALTGMVLSGLCCCTSGKCEAWNGRASGEQEWGAGRPCGVEG